MENSRVKQPKPSRLSVSPPGDLQIGLQALLKTHLDLDVLVVGEGSSALKVINHQNPAVVILDHNLPGNTGPKIIRDIKIDWPGIICIVLINDEQGRQSFLEVLFLALIIWTAWKWPTSESQQS